MHHATACTTPRHARHYSTVLRTPHHCMHYSTALHSTALHSTALHSAALHFTPQHHITACTAPHHTAQHHTTDTTAYTALLNLTRLDCFSGHDRVSEKESSSLSQIVNESHRNSSFTRQALITHRTPSDHSLPHITRFFSFFPHIFPVQCSSVMQARTRGSYQINRNILTRQAKNF